MRDVRSVVFLQYFDDTMSVVSGMLPEDKGLRILPDKAVSFKRFLVFVTSIFSETLQRMVELRSDPQPISGFVYINAIPTTIEVAEKKCRTVTEFSLLREELERRGGVLILNRCGTVSVLHEKDIIENYLPEGK